VLQFLNTCAKWSLKPTSGTVIFWQYRNCARYNKNCCRRSNTAGRRTAVFKYVLENCYEREYYNPKTKSNYSLL